MITSLPIEWQDLRRKQIHLYFLQNKSYALPKTSWFKFLHILKYVCHTSVVHMLWKLWSRYFFVEAKFPWKLTFHQFWWQDFFSFKTSQLHIWTHMTETVPKIQFISDFISDIISSLKLYFRRDTDGGKIVTYFVTCEFLWFKAPITQMGKNL